MSNPSMDNTLSATEFAEDVELSVTQRLLRLITSLAKAPGTILNALRNHPLALLPYIVPVIGGIIGLAVNRDNSLTRTHGQQSIAAVLMMIITFIAWMIFGYIIALIPSVGPIFAVCLFALVIAMFIFLSINWIISLVFAIQGKERVIPMSNQLVNRLFGESQKVKTV